MKRRRFLFWIGLGVFSLGERLNAAGFDELAAAIMPNDAGAPSDGAAPRVAGAAPIHWRAVNNRTWQWYEREKFINGQWRVTGITTPVHRETGERFTGAEGYLDESLIPSDARVWTPDASDVEDARENLEPGQRRPSPVRRDRHGRPPSLWLRSLRADELRIWLKTIDVPLATVEGMTYWTHLTRDHYFDENKIAGLSEDEQAKLHAAAHHGY